MIKNNEVRRFNKDNEMEGTSKINSMVANMFIDSQKQYVHHYEIFPYTYNSIISMNGKVIDKQSYDVGGSKHKVIYNGSTTIVILSDGTKGVSKRNPKDDYHKGTGYAIASRRARIKKLQKEIAELSQ
jgi:hypothetical protein